MELYWKEGYPYNLPQQNTTDDFFNSIPTTLVVTTFLTTFLIFVIYATLFFYVLRKTKKEALRHYSAAIVLTAFFVSFFSRTLTDLIRIIIRAIDNNEGAKNSLLSVIVLMSFFNSLAVTAKTYVIFTFIFELFELRLKLESF